MCSLPPACRRPPPPTAAALPPLDPGTGLVPVTLRPAGQNGACNTPALNDLCATVANVDCAATIAQPECSPTQPNTNCPVICLPGYDTDVDAFCQVATLFQHLMFTPCPVCRLVPQLSMQGGSFVNLASVVCEDCVYEGPPDTCRIDATCTGIQCDDGSTATASDVCRSTDANAFLLCVCCVAPVNAFCSGFTTICAGIVCYDGTPGPTSCYAVAVSSMLPPTPLSGCVACSCRIYINFAWFLCAIGLLFFRLVLLKALTVMMAISAQMMIPVVGLVASIAPVNVLVLLLQTQPPAMMVTQIPMATNAWLAYVGAQLATLVAQESCHVQSSRSVQIMERLVMMATSAHLMMFVLMQLAPVLEQVNSQCCLCLACALVYVNNRCNALDHVPLLQIFPWAQHVMMEISTPMRISAMGLAGALVPPAIWVIRERCLVRPCKNAQTMPPHVMMETSVLTLTYVLAVAVHAQEVLLVIPSLVMMPTRIPMVICVMGLGAALAQPATIPFRGLIPALTCRNVRTTWPHAMTATP